MISKIIGLFLILGIVCSGETYSLYFFIALCLFALGNIIGHIEGADSAYKIYQRR